MSTGSSIDIRQEFANSLLSQGLTATTGAEVELGWSSGVYAANWIGKDGITRSCAYRAIRNQSASDITVVVHPIQGYTASAGTEKNLTLKIPALGACYDYVFDKIIDSGSSLLDADVHFIPVTVR